MRRRNPVSVRVKAPSRGLVTRLPTELADTLKPGDAQRTFVAASNVRFEDGVVANAPGYSSMVLESGGTQLLSLLGDVVAHYKFDLFAEKTGTEEEDGVPIDVYTYYVGQDSSPNQRDLTFNLDQFFKPVGLSAGKFGNAAVVTAHQYLKRAFAAPDLSLAAPGSFSFSGWVKVSGAAGQFRLIGLGGIKTPSGQTATGFSYTTYGSNVTQSAAFSWELRLVGSQLKFVMQNAAGTVFEHTHSTALVADQWQFFAVAVRTINEVRITVNGTTQTFTQTEPIYYDGSGAALYVGGCSSGTVPTILIDSLTFWDGPALSAAEAAQLYNSGLGLAYPFVGKCTHVAQGNVLQEDPYPLFFGTTQNLYLVNKNYNSTTSSFSASLASIYTVPANVSVDVSDKWSSCDFYNKVVFAQSGCPTQYYFGGSATADLPGLPEGWAYDGVTAFQNHLLQWRDSTLYWSDLNNANLWIPVGETVFSGRFTLASSFPQPAATGTTSDYVYLTESPDGLTVGQYVVIEEPSTDYFSVTGATNASPIVLSTGAAHSFVVGDRVNVSGVVGNTAANGNWTVSSVGSTTVTLSSAQGNGTYVSGGLVQRIPFSNYYTVSEVTPVSDTTSHLLAPCNGAATQVLPGSGSGTLLTTLLFDWEVGTKFTLGSNATVLTVSEVNTSPVPSGVLSFSVRTSAAYNTTTVEVAHDNTGLREGRDYVSISGENAPGVDVFLVEKVELISPTGQPAYTRLTVQKKNIGTNVKTSGSYLPGNYVTWTPSITVANPGSTITVNSDSSPAARTLLLKYGVKLTVETLTGRRTSGSVPAGRFLVTLDANEAGSAQIVGASDNGDIYQVVPLGDYAIIFKHRTVQAVQYVGRLSGTFFIRTELRDEGLIGRNSVVRLNDNRLVFLGNRELYDYRGGSNLTPVAQQFTRTLFADLDRARVDEVLLHHREERNEVWVLYPVKGSQRVLIWNYVEDTVSLDDYTDDFASITAVAQTRWGQDPRWVDMGLVLWKEVGNTDYWDTFTSSGEELVTLMASSDEDILMHGLGYSRDGLSYASSAETQDHDFGDPDVYKYVDTVVVQLDVRDYNPAVVKTLYIEVGTKDTADGAVTWSSPKPVYVQGSGQKPTKVNPGGAGRYVRLRFSSDTADCNWRVSGYEIHARRGGTY